MGGILRFTLMAFGVLAVFVLIVGCGHEYGANGSDIFQRKCPNCQGGASGLPLE